MFAPATYQQRRQSLFQLMGRAEGLLLFPGNDESPMNYRDNTYHFRQDSTFLYYFGIDKPGLFATMDMSSGEATLYGEEITMDHVVWMGPQPSLAEFAAAAGGMKVGSQEDLTTALAQCTRLNRPVHLLPAYRGETRIRLASWLGCAPAALPVSESLIRAVVKQRSIKSAEEIAQLDLACTLTANMHARAMRMARPGMLEAEVMAAVKQEALAANSDTSFPIICSVRGEVLHNHFHGNRLREGQLLLVDAGGESPLHYAGDMTRTFPVSGKFTQQQQEIYEIVRSGVELALDMIRPGISYLEVHLAVARSLTVGLQQVGLMHGDPDESVAAGAHALFFPHGLGHMLGLDVHDMENLGEAFVGYAEGQQRSGQFGLKSLRLARPLEQGFALTVEPGLYFIPPLIGRWKQEKRWEAFIHFDKLASYLDFGGIRIEEDVIVTESGGRVLGERLASKVDAVEALRAEALQA